MIRQLAIGLVLLVALASGHGKDETKPIVTKDSLPSKHVAANRMQHYDWNKWFSKTGKPSEASKDGKKNWDKWMSFSYIDPPSGLSEEYSFKPYNWKSWISKGKEQSDSIKDEYDWKSWISRSYVPSGVQYYDWQQWLSKTGGKSGGSGKDTFDWKKFLSNSYNKIPSGLEEEYSFSTFDWEKFIQYYDWQKWLSKTDGKSEGSGKDTFDWKKFLSNSYNKIPSGLEEKYSFSPFDWEKFVSQ